VGAHLGLEGQELQGAPPQLLLRKADLIVVVLHEGAEDRKAHVIDLLVLGFLECGKRPPLAGGLHDVDDPVQEHEVAPRGQHDEGAADGQGDDCEAQGGQYDPFGDAVEGALRVRST
jgi:hypothetical protein